jgi:hypothetical protein
MDESAPGELLGRTKTQDRLLRQRRYQLQEVGHEHERTHRTRSPWVLYQPAKLRDVIWSTVEFFKACQSVGTDVLMPRFVRLFDD